MPAFTTVAAALISLLSSISSTLAQASVPIAATTATTIPFPSTTLANSDAQSFIQSSWGLSKGRIQTGASNLDFVPDPFPNNPAPRVQSNTTGPVLRVLYHAGSFSDVDDGGAQFYALWNSSGDPFRSMSVSYEVAFDTGFDWVKGGKLPGLRGGDPNGCSGGNEADGETCFSSRFMWRKNGQGEMYAYIPEDNDICDASDVKCNDEFGASVGRGEFSFASGQWNKVTMAIWLNSPVDTANGRAQLYYNDILVTDRSDLVFRTTDSLTANGLYFSTFFGGSDDSWAPPSDTHTYFRNFVLNGGSSASNLTGAKITSGASAVVGGGRGSVWRGLAVVVGCAVVGAVVGV